MIIRGISLGEGECLAAQVGVRLYNVRVKDEGFNCKLLPVHDGSHTYQRKPTVYAGRRPSPMRYINAVCWHGYRAFMAAVFELEPTATVKTNMATYHGRAEFEAKADSTGKAEPPISGGTVTYQSLCDCEPKVGAPFATLRS